MYFPGGIDQSWHYSKQRSESSPTNVSLQPEGLGLRDARAVPSWPPVTGSTHSETSNVDYKHYSV